MIKAIVFDLDNCLSAADQIPEVLEPVFSVIRQANCFSSEQLDAVILDLWRHPLDWVMQKHGFSADLQAKVWEAYKGLELPRPMRGYSDIGLLSTFEQKLFLVTSGFRRLQESKIQSLALGRYCEVRIDAIDEPNRKGKQPIFTEILAENQLAPDEVLVVGDNPDSELQAANNLNIPSVQILRPGVPKGLNARYYVSDLTDLFRLIETISPLRREG